VPLRCASESELLLFALTGESGEAPVPGHLRECAACGAWVAELRQVMRGTLASASAAVAGDGECLDELALAELLEAGGGQEPLRSQRIAHVAECGHCRTELAALARLLGDPGLNSELVRLQSSGSWSPRRKQLVGAGLIAALVLLAVGLPRLVERPASLHRDPTITATTAPLPLAPVGDVGSADTLRWTAVSGADRYRVTLFDASGRVRFETQSADTIAVLPDSVALAPGRSYLWKVEARTELERWASSELIEFRVSRPRSP